MGNVTVIRILYPSDFNELGAGASGGMSGLGGAGASGGMTGLGVSGGLSGLGGSTRVSGGLSANLPQGSRLVVLRATARFNEIYGKPANLAPELRADFTAGGWNIVTLSVSKDANFSNAVTIDIQANVHNTNTAEEVRQSAARVLQNSQRWFVTTYNTLLNVDVKIVADYKTTTTVASNQNSSSNSSGFLSGWGLGTTSGNSNGSGDGIGTSIFSSFAGGAGASTPFALLGLLILIVLITRR